MSDWHSIAEDLPFVFGAPKLSGPRTGRRRAHSLPSIHLFGRDRVRRDQDLCSHLVQDRAITDPDRMALRCGLLALSYRDFHMTILEAAKRLHSFGLRKGDRVIVVSESGFQAIALILALGELETCILAVNARMPESQLRSIRNSNAHHRMIYCAGDSSAAAACAKLEPSRAEFSLLGPVIVQEIAEPPSVERGFQSQRRRSMISFTRGNLGGSFCAGLRHRRLLENASYLAGVCAVGANDVIYNCAPITSIEGFLVTLAALYAGAGVELVVDPDPEHFVWRLNEGRVSCLIATQAFFLEILTYAKVNGHVLSCRKLRLISTDSEAVDPDLEAAVLDAFNQRVHRLGFGRSRGSIARHDIETQSMRGK